MPIIRVTLPAVFNAEEKAALFHGLTQAAHQTVDAPLSAVRVVLLEVPAQNFAHAGAGLNEQTVIQRTPGTPGT